MTSYDTGRENVSGRRRPRKTKQLNLIFVIYQIDAPTACYFHSDFFYMSKPFYHLQGLNCRDGIECSELEAPLWRASFVAREVILICPEGMSTDEQDIYFNALIKYMVSIHV